MKKRAKTTARSQRDFNLIIGYALITLAFLAVAYFTYFYFLNNTNFVEETNRLIEGKQQVISVILFRILVFGIVAFGLSLVFLPDVWKVFLSFIGEVILISASALFLIGVLIPDLKPLFRLAFIISAFIIYYVVFQIKKRAEGA